MHQIKTSIRKILPSELPTVTPIGEASRPMNEQEMLNAGLVPLGSDLYSCICQEERDPETLEWQPKEGQAPPGEVVTEGLLRDRHERLPREVKDKILKATVIRSTVGNADDLASAILIDAAAEADKVVGEIDGAPLLDVSDAGLILAEAQRQEGIPESGFTRETVGMADLEVGDVIEAEDLIPHSWAGEPKR